MSVSGPANYGTLMQGGIRIARQALVDGERVRPRYLGKVVDLRRMPRSAKPNMGRVASRLVR